MKRALLALALVCSAVVASTTPAAAAESSTPVAADPVAADPVVVTPETALFDVHLRPGEMATSSAQVTNSSSQPAIIAVSAAVTRSTGRLQLATHLDVTAMVANQCTADLLGAGGTTKLAALNQRVGTVAPNSTANVCFVVRLPADAPVESPVSATVDFTFRSMLEGSPESGGILPPTGAQIPWLLIALAIGLLVLGLHLARRRRDDERQPTPPLLSRTEP